MAATARMKDGGECDLVSRLCEEKEIGLNKSDLTALLQPELYTGRCETQVTNYIRKVRGSIAGADRIPVDIDN